MVKLAPDIGQRRAHFDGGLYGIIYVRELEL